MWNSKEAFKAWSHKNPPLRPGFHNYELQLAFDGGANWAIKQIKTQESKQNEKNMITKEQAIELFESNFWENMSHKEIARFQMNEKLLCMPFDVFHKAIEETLGRPVFTHEFALNAEGIKKEINGEIGPPSFEEICNLIPAEKRIIVVVGE